jgi:NAD(P)-dependent dehydrogenase (short-subunit alcohol dehydrogenase family)
MKRVLVTGANSGIGFATSLDLARNGYRVLAGMRNPERGTELLRQAAAENLPIEPVQLDVADPRSCDAAVSSVLERHGAIDVLVNNAGIGIIAPIEDADLTEVRAGFEVNFFGPMRLIQLVLPGMRARSNGCIVNVSSATGRLAMSPQAFYSASKFALGAATEVLAQEVRKFGIRVVLIEPGVTRTAALEKMPNIKPDSAYLSMLIRAGAVVGKCVENAAEAGSVAVGIRNAIESSEYRLRHPLGEDTRKWFGGRAKLSDELWVDYGREMDHDELSTFWKKHFDMTI